jgi:hypothetical protein
VASVDRTGWQDQWDRIGRFLSRFEEITIGRPHTRPTEFYTDLVYATFQNLWHMKDWLKNDGHADVEQFCRAQSALMLCADLANGSKHLVLTNHKIDPASGVKSRHIHWKANENKVAIRYDVEANGQTLDAWELACDAKVAWVKYLQRKGLL